MTRNQISYAEYVENKRSNIAKERETARHNRNDEAIRSETNRITSQHNVAVEEISRQQNAINQAHYERMDAETQRSNLANESIKEKANSINQAHFERLDAETKRANLAKEAENSAHNRASESLQAEQNAISWQNAQAQNLRGAAAMTTAYASANKMNKETEVLGVLAPWDMAIKQSQVKQNTANTAYTVSRTHDTDVNTYVKWADVFTKALGNYGNLAKGLLGGN